jgi:hypothetical protein
LLRIVLVVAIVACLWVFVLQPSLMKSDPGGKLSAETARAGSAAVQIPR